MLQSEFQQTNVRVCHSQPLGMQVSWYGWHMHPFTKKSTVVGWSWYLPWCMASCMAAITSLTMKFQTFKSLPQSWPKSQKLISRGGSLHQFLKHHLYLEMNWFQEKWVWNATESTQLFKSKLYNNNIPFILDWWSQIANLRNPTTCLNSVKVIL